MGLLSINDLWESRDEKQWRHALERYWERIKPENRDLEDSMQALGTKGVSTLGVRDWYEFLLNKYFRWKYTQPNRLASTTKLFRTYEDERKLDYFYRLRGSSSPSIRHRSGWGWRSPEPSAASARRAHPGSWRTYFRGGLELLINLW